MLPPHRETTHVLRAVYPGMAGGGLDCPLVYVGDVVTGGGSFAFDAFDLYQPAPAEDDLGRRRITNPNVAVFGVVGAGKSALAKTVFVTRPLVFGRHVWVITPRREYDPVVAAARDAGVPTTFLVLDPAGGQQLNPLDPSVPVAAQHNLLEAMVEAAEGRRLAGRERSVLRAARAAAVEQATAEGRVPILSDVVAAMLAPTDGMVEHVAGESRDHVKQMGYDVALSFRDLLDELAGMFDGPSSPGIDLDARLVVLDLSAVQEASALSERALAVSVACCMTFLQGKLNDRSGGRRLNVVLDEARQLIRLESMAAFLSGVHKLIRDKGASMVSIYHRLSDLDSVADEGSRHQALVRGLLEDTGTQVILRQEERGASLAAEVLGLSDTEQEVVVDLPDGVALWRPGGVSTVVQHRVGDREWPLIDTDAAMLGRARTLTAT